MNTFEKYLTEEKSLDGMLKNIQKVIDMAKQYGQSVKKYESDTALFSRFVQKSLTRTVQNDDWYRLEDGYAELVNQARQFTMTARDMEASISAIRSQMR